MNYKSIQGSKSFWIILDCLKTGIILNAIPAPGVSFSCLIEREYENQTKQSSKTPPLTPLIPFSI